MKSKLLIVLCAAVFLSLPFTATAQWITDYNAALRKAEAENKAVLINFTGSDWCGWCIKLKDEVFSKPEFNTFAEQNLVLLEIDFPRRKSLPSGLEQANQKLAKQFGVRGYPTVYIVNSKGAILKKTGYMRGGAKAYVADIQTTPGFAWKGVEAPAPAPGNAQNPQAANKNAELPPYAVAPPVIRYDEIALKGISGGRVPMALINNKSFAAGERANVKLADKTVEITVKEIRESSVLVQIEGEAEPRELLLKQNEVVQKK